MSTLRRAGLLFALLVTPCVACSSSNGSAHEPDAPDAGTLTSPDAGVASGDFSISVTGATFARSIGAEQPATGNVFVEVNVTLANQGESPILDTFALYSLTTTAALVHPASPASASLTPSCSTLSVAKGGSFSCAIAFEVSAGETPSQLDYADPTANLSATAPVGSVPPLAAATCEDWTRAGGESCIDCVAGAPGEACSGDYIYANGGPCSSDCTSLFPNGLASDCVTDLLSTCTPSAQCQSAIDALNTCLANACNSVCL